MCFHEILMFMLNWDDNKYNIIQLENQGKISPIQTVKGLFSLSCGLQAHEGVWQMDEMTETEDDQKKRSWQTKKLRRFFHDDSASQDSRRRRDSSKQYKSYPQLQLRN